MTNDELAEAVKDLIESHGACLTRLSFETRKGAHSYRTIQVQEMGDAVARAALVPDKSGT